MSSIDERIVAMRFNNQQFEKGVKETTSSLDGLKKSLSLEGAKKGLQGLQEMGQKFSLSGIASGIENVASKFTALGVVGITALTNLTNKAVNAGMAMAKSLTLDPIMAGFGEYELKMGSIQTILANTQRYGTTLPEVTGALDELNTYADKTIYNFGDMTKNIGLFTNAGIRIEDATSMIKGFSNTAAASGTNAEQAAGAAYQLSQALSAGKVTLMDWRSLQNAGMGNKNMQQGILDIAGAMGTLDDAGTSAEEVQANFNGSLEKGWLKADVMSNYLKIMAGDMTEAEQAALGLSDAQIAAFKTQQKTAEEAATKVRTWTQLVGTMREAVGSGWSETFDILIGDFDQATEVFTAVNNVFGGIIGDMAKTRNDLLRGFAEGGGRDAIIEGISNAWQALNQIIMPIKSAFKEIFPPITVQTLLKIADGFRNFTKAMQPSADTMKQLKRIFLGVFSVLDIGWMIIKQVASVLGDLFGLVTQNSGGFLEIAANIGDFLVKLRDAIKNGDGLTKIFGHIKDALKGPVEFLGKLGGYIADFTAVESWEDAWGKVGDTFRKIGDGLKKVWDWMQPFFHWIGEAFTNIKNVLTDFFKSLSFDDVMNGLQTGAIVGVGTMFGILVGKILGLFKKGKDAGPGFKDLIKGIFSSITDTFGEMQKTLKATTLIAIAIAIALITASVIALSFVDTDKLAGALAAIGGMMYMLNTMMKALEASTKEFKIGKMLAVGITLGLLAVAMLILSAALLVMSRLSWEELAKGMAGMAGGLLILTGGMRLMPKEGEMVKMAFGIGILGGAMFILAFALQKMADISWGDLGKGLAAVAAALIVIDLFAPRGKNMAGLALGAIGIMLISGAMVVLAKAIAAFGAMDMETIGKGLLVMGGSLLMIGIAMKAIPPDALASAAVLVIVSYALGLIYDTLKKMGGMSWEEIGKSMVVLAGSLLILSGAMALMGIPEVLLGAVGIVAAALALMMMAPALVLMGKMSWEEIGKGLALLASALGIMAVMGILLIPASVGFALLGAGIFLLGTGALMAGQGLMLFAAGLVLLAGAGVAGAIALRAAILIIIGLIPAILIAIADGIIAFAKEIAKGGVEFTAAFVMLIQAVIDAINIMAPQVVDTIVNLIHLLVDAIVEMVPYLVDSGMKLLIGLMQGIKDNLPQIISLAGDIIAELITGLGNNAYKIATAGGEAALKFINGIATWIDNNGWRFEQAGSRLFRAIVNGVSNAIENGGNLLRWAGERIGNAIVEGTKNALGINSPSKVFRDELMPSVFEGVEDGNAKNLKRAEYAGSDIGYTMIDSMKKSIADVASAVAVDIGTIQPTITPVLDLSLVKKDANTVGGMFGTPTLALDKSYNSAATIAAGYQASGEPATAPVVAAPVTNVNFVQNNTSPKALSTLEIYRQTNNQISTVKGALNI